MKNSSYRLAGITVLCTVLLQCTASAGPTSLPYYIVFDLPSEALDDGVWRIHFISDDSYAKYKQTRYENYIETKRKCGTSDSFYMGEKGEVQSNAAECQDFRENVWVSDDAPSGYALDFKDFVYPDEDYGTSHWHRFYHCTVVNGACRMPLPSRGAGTYAWSYPDQGGKNDTNYYVVLEKLDSDRVYFSSAPVVIPYRKMIELWNGLTCEEKALSQPLYRMNVAAFEISEPHSLKMAYDGQLTDIGFKRRNFMEKFFDWVVRTISGKNYC